MNDLGHDALRGTNPEAETVRGVTRWLSIHDDLLRGLTHTLSNRVGTIAAAAYMVEVQPASLATSAAALRAESETLEALLRLFRMLPRRMDHAAEPVIPTDAAHAAVELYGHHPKHPITPVVVTVDGDLQPAYADPATLTMAIVVGLDAANRATTDHRLEITISCSTEWVTVCVHAQVGAIDTDVADNLLAISWLLSPFNGHSAPHALGASFMIPTLQAARRAQRG